MTHPVLERRRRQRDARLEVARRWVPALTDRLARCGVTVRAVVVVGSVARGDFNKWSDLDVLVVADPLPDGARERLALLTEDAPPGLQPVGWTPGELARRRDRRDPIAVEADTVGVVAAGALPRGGVPEAGG